MATNSSDGGVIKFNWWWRRRELLALALTHSSLSNETGAESNQRLEFLGDAVLDLLLADRLMRLHPDWDEGRLSIERSRRVSEAALAAVARNHGIGAMLRVGRGSERNGDRDRPSVLADAVEAIIGAAFQDGGLVGAGEVAGDLGIMPEASQR